MTAKSVLVRPGARAPLATPLLPGHPILAKHYFSHECLHKDLFGVTNHLHRIKVIECGVSANPL